MKTLNMAPMFYGAKPELFEFAKRMRNAPTETEKLMWQILNAGEFRQYKFRRQHPLSRYIPDFYSHSLLLVIEIDGGYHLKEEQKEYDVLKDDDLQNLNIKVLRFTNDEILEQPYKVLSNLKNTITQRLAALTL